MLIEIQDDRVATALTAVADKQQAVNQAKEQLDMLVSYRAEYEQRFREKTKLGIHPVHLRNYQAFISKLHYAIDQQQNVVKTLEQQLAQRQQIWIEEKNQFNAYEKLKERQDRIKEKKESRKEQKLSDEFGAKKYADKRRMSFGGM